MKKTHIFGAVVAGVVVAVAGVALASSFSASKQVDFFAPGKHEFYVWCAGGSDYTATAQGKSAADAQMKLYNSNKAHGHASCWPVWQAKVG
jgi:hypothetical protein